MSTAFYPTNMRQMPSGGYNHNSTLQNIPYISWKGTGPFSNPIGLTSTNIRPLTNKDSGNIFPTGFGLPRPIKHYRKGIFVPIHTNDDTIISPDIDYNINRRVKSSNGSSLGGGSGGQGLISQIIDQPGLSIIKENKLTMDNTIDEDCKTCEGQGFVSDWYPINNLTEKPQPNVMNHGLCCNQERKAIQRTLPTSTNLSKNYFQTTKMYLYNRCQTFGQREFNFINGPINNQMLNLFKSYPNVTIKMIEYSKPGDPLSILNQYVAQCNPNFTVELGAETAFIISLTNLLLNEGFISTEIYNSIIENTTLTIQDFVQLLKSLLTQTQYEQTVDYIYAIAANPYINLGTSNPKGCAQVYYKPNNPQYAKQGAVSSSARLLKLNVDTINTAAAKQKNNIYKEKVPQCNPAIYTGNPFFFNGQKQNNKICSKSSADMYKNFVSVYQHAASNNIGNIN